MRRHQGDIRQMGVGICVAVVQAEGVGDRCDARPGIALALERVVTLLVDNANCGNKRQGQDFFLQVIDLPGIQFPERCRERRIVDSLHVLQALMNLAAHFEVFNDHLGDGYDECDNEVNRQYRHQELPTQPFPVFVSQSHA